MQTNQCSDKNGRQLRYETKNGKTWPERSPKQACIIRLKCFMLHTKFERNCGTERRMRRGKFQQQQKQNQRPNLREREGRGGAGTALLERHASERALDLLFGGIAPHPKNFVRVPPLRGPARRRRVCRVSLLRLERTEPRSRHALPSSATSSAQHQGPSPPHGTARPQMSRPLERTNSGGGARSTKVCSWVSSGCDHGGELKKGKRGGRRDGWGQLRLFPMVYPYIQNGSPTYCSSSIFLLPIAFFLFCPPCSWYLI
jgi:hypothetical protein